MEKKNMKQNFLQRFSNFNFRKKKKKKKRDEKKKKKRKKKKKEEPNCYQHPLFMNPTTQHMFYHLF